jgi:hypothetical protein
VNLATCGVTFPLLYPLSANLAAVTSIPPAQPVIFVIFFRVSKFGQEAANRKIRASGFKISHFPHQWYELGCVAILPSITTITLCSV